MFHFYTDLKAFTGGIEDEYWLNLGLLVISYQSYFDKPAGIYLFKVNTENTSEIYVKSVQN